MRSLRFVLPIALILAFLFAVFFYREGINGFLFRSRSLVVGLFDRSFDYAGFLKLKTENEGLRAQIDQLNFRIGLSEAEDYKTAGVYSRYPFNDRRLIVINLGSRDGLKEGMPVFAAEGVILGRITGVKRSQSLVTTIFDPEWRGSVSIGNDTVKALLRGGLPPSVELVSKSAEIKDGESVLNLSPEFPLHAFLGTIQAVSAGVGDVWQKAELQTPYNLDDLNEVLVLTNFP
ncbi:MAG: Cell shape-determining protein MreC [Candidatus Jorgensenbacteria bacterium GW2011_GWA1_48_13]|uniref:Cell shape-determining protein MreC n=1 Tax=Candidatus Jorgensenbacteria bacterium GW2011_GWB1_50_10 TaxID=1618665 RepID=A0A0G1W8P4_9BACT|nr:MAG: Cell shape-determining protein MreC [Candidatus Jorgensenbacteria bacterium GW2011_GWA1_48_13]KKW15166.1 MAG: Cell shape-determining protein MreC [Candidatus Jorgensenbacteria bacterium GW2011_GWB1_50_10]